MSYWPSITPASAAANYTLGDYTYTRLVPPTWITYTAAATMCRLHDPNSWLITVENLGDVGTIFSALSVPYPTWLGYRIMYTTPTQMNVVQDGGADTPLTGLGEAVFTDCQQSQTCCITRESSRLNRIPCTIMPSNGWWGNFISGKTQTVVCKAPNPGLPPATPPAVPPSPEYTGGSTAGYQHRAGHACCSTPTIPYTLTCSWSGRVPPLCGAYPATPPLMHAWRQPGVVLSFFLSDMLLHGMLNQAPLPSKPHIVASPTALWEFKDGTHGQAPTVCAMLR
jgi:hypothetical protein